MKVKVGDNVGPEEIRVLVVGNNPIELGRIFESLSQVEGKKIVSRIAFDLKTALERLVSFTPQFILIDDNIGKDELKSTMTFFLRDKRTKDTPITILKNSNYQESIERGILNYVLKANITAESLYKELVSSLRLKRTQEYLLEAYKKRKGQLIRILKSDPVF